MASIVLVGADNRLAKLTADIPVFIKEVLAVGYLKLASQRFDLQQYGKIELEGHDAVIVVRARFSGDIWLTVQLIGGRYQWTHARVASYLDVVSYRRYRRTAKGTEEVKRSP